MFLSFKGADFDGLLVGLVGEYKISFYRSNNLEGRYYCPHLIDCDILPVSISEFISKLLFLFNLDHV